MGTDTGKLTTQEDVGVSARRQLKGTQALIASVASVVWVSFHLACAAGVLRPYPMEVKLVHLTFGLVLCFLLVPPARRYSNRPPLLVDYLLIASSVASLGYLWLRYDTMIRMAGRYTSTDIVMGLIGLIVLFEAARRVVSPGLVVLAAVAVAYAYAGRLIHGPFQHAGVDIEGIVRHLMLTQEGVFGFVLGVSAEIIIIFVAFGSVLKEVKVADFFYDFSNSVSGRTRGGPAKIAVISSGLVGMVSGETSANVTTTGTFTIPLMKRAGYPAYFAGAVEAAASAGGQIMPPVMGATAFVMADSLGIPYARIALAAAIPAFLYFLGVFGTVHFRAVSLGLRGLRSEEIPKLGTVLRTRGYMILPLVGIVVGMLMNYTPTKAAFWGGIVVALILGLLRPETRLTWKKAVSLLETTAKTAMGLAIATAIVGVVVGVASLTGITMTLSDKIFGLAGGNLLLALFLTMVVSIVLGMGVPTTPAYVLCAISAAPVLLRMGIPEMAAHMFVFYFGCMSALTPPVCTGAYTAAGLAGANPNRVGWTSVKLALAGFIVPFLFVYKPELLLGFGAAPLQTVESLLWASMGILGLAAALEGSWATRMALPWRAALGISSVMLILPERISSVVGAVAMIVILVANSRQARLTAADSAVAKDL